MLERPGTELLSSLARLAESESGQALLAWMESSRQKTLEAIEQSGPDMAHERGQCWVLRELAREIKGAREALAQRRR
jgi:hypothetical protein